MFRSFSFLCLIGAAFLLVVQDANAQFGVGGVRSVRNSTRNFLYNRPTVSPYLQLTSRDANQGLPNYFTQVRPQIERQQQEIAQRRQSAQMQAQLNQVQSQVVQNQQQAAGMMFTGRNGWSSRGFSRFGLYLNYYPGMNRIGR